MFFGCLSNLDTHNFIQAGRGLLRSMKGESKAVADIVPVDIPVNIMIIVARYTAITRPKNILIYHATTGRLNPFTWGDISKIQISCLFFNDFSDMTAI